MCREALPHLLETKGTIVNCASTASHFGHPWMAAYASSKGGIAALTQALAVEYAKQGVRVNAIAPGSVETGISTNITFPDGADFKLLPRIMSPTGPGQPESVASVVAMLASDGRCPHDRLARAGRRRHARMRFSIGLAYSPPEHYVPIAKAADEAGYHAIAVSDHVINLEELKTPYPYTPDGSRRWEPFTPWPDPWVSIGAMAAATERLSFFTNVYVLPMRNVFHVAKAVGTAAAISGNRVALGIGMGWCEEEFDLMEQPFRKRGKRGRRAARGAAQGVDRRDGRAPRRVLRLPQARDEPAAHRARCRSTWAAPAMPRSSGPPATTAGSPTSPPPRSSATSASASTPTAPSTGAPTSPSPWSGRPATPFDVDAYRRVEDVGVTDLLTMPWFFYSGFTEDLQEKIDGIHRFAEEILSHFEPEEGDV